MDKFDLANASSDELLAEWASLLRCRDRLNSSGTHEFIARCNGHEFNARYWQTGMLHEFLEVFDRAISIQISEIEDRLRDCGINVTREKR